MKNLGIWASLAVPLDGWDVIHASPPCQEYSTTRSLHSNRYPDLVSVVRDRIWDHGPPPYVIENVPRAPLVNAVQLCGSSFGLGVRRHRRFEISPWMTLVPPCVHHLQPEPIDVTGGGPTRPGRTRTTGGVSRKPKSVVEARRAMGIDWMTREELNEAIPPAYTAYLGQHIMEFLLSSNRPSDTCNVRKAT
jgi:DNA (cytosine-5)-methyltransferase 1